MDDDVISLKLAALDRCIARIREKAPADAASLALDVDRQDIIVLNLQRAVQVCVDIASRILAALSVPPPMTMAESFERLHEAGVISGGLAERMRRSVGFRNIAVHEYDSLDWDVVFAVVTGHLDDFVKYGEAVTAWLDKEGGSGEQP